MTMTMSQTARMQHRTLPYAGLAGIVIVYLVIVQGLGALLSQGTESSYATFPDVETVLRVMTIPVGLSALFGIAVISVLRVWPDVIHEDNPVQSWVWIVPISMLVSAVIVTDYANLGTLDSGLLATMVLSSLLVGIGEELMFRGVVIQTLRGNGMTEHRVALWSSVIFGGAHITNLFSEGVQAIGQVVVVCLAGFLFYLTYRVTGTIIGPILMHAIWDFSLFSANIGDPDPDAVPRYLVWVPMLAVIILGIIVYVRRDRIDPATTETVAATS